MKINLNDFVTVELTKEGAKAFNSYHNSFQYPSKPPREDVGEGYVLKEQLWVLFQIFGEHTYLGGRSMFNGCIIEMQEEVR